jgi:deoxyribodipyrimidine photo-lyase
MDTAIVIFTRDLRLHDNPALHQACARARQVVPLFVVDPALGTGLVQHRVVMQPEITREDHDRGVHLR